MMINNLIFCQISKLTLICMSHCWERNNPTAKQTYFNLSVNLWKSVVWNSKMMAHVQNILILDSQGR